MRFLRAQNREMFLRFEIVLRTVFRVLITPHIGSAFCCLGLLCIPSFGFQGPKTCTGPLALQQDIEANPSAGGYSALGAYFAQRREMACAFQAFETSLKLDPEFWEARYNYGVALLQEKAYARAIKQLQIAVKQKPESVLAHNGLGTAFQAQGNLDDAEASLKVALAADPNSIYALQHLGEVLLAQKRYAPAISYLLQAVTLEPDALDHQSTLGVAYAENGETENAVHTFQTALASHPDSADTYFKLGTVNANSLRYQNAADAFRRSLELNPSDDMCRAALVKVLLILADYSAALPLVNDYAVRHPDDFDAYHFKGVILRGLGRFVEAEVELHRALRKKPNDYDCLYNLGVVLTKLNKLTEARSCLEQAERLQPDSQEVRYQLASVLSKLNDSAGAEERLERFHKAKQMERSATVAATLSSEANENLLKGEAKRSVELNRKALELDPNNGKTHYNLAISLEQTGDRVEGKKELEEALRLDPKLALAHNQLGILLLGEEKLDEAEAEFKAALNGNAQLAEVQNNLGTVYGQKGQNDLAERMYRLAVESNPRYDQAKVNLSLVVAAQGRYAEALQEISRALPALEKDVRTLTAMGMFQAKLEKFQDSAVTLRKVVALTPDSATAHLNLGIALAGVYDLNGALDEFSETVRLAPNQAGGHYEKGRILYDLHRYPEAEIEQDAARKLDANFTPALYDLALIARRNGNHQAAAEFLREVVKVDPTNVPALTLLAQSLLHQGESKEAIHYWELALKGDPENGEALYNLARISDKESPEQAKILWQRFQSSQEKKNILDQAERLNDFGLASASARDWTEAIAQLHEALTLCRSCRAEATLHKNLGLIYCRSGEIAKGRQELEKAQTLNAHDPDISKALAIVNNLPRAKLGSF